MAAVTVVGSINRDIVAFVPRLPAPGETVLGHRAAQFPGGKGANQAVAAVRLGQPAGAPVRMVGCVGADAFGDEMRAFLAGEGINVSGVRRREAIATGIALITVDTAGENAIAVVPGANHAWDDGLPPLSLAARDVVVCQLEIPLRVVSAVFTAARAARATTILNPAPFQSLPSDLLPLIDVLILNEVELAQMLGRDMPVATGSASLAQAARDVLGRGPRAIIATLGAAGCLVIDAAGRTEHIAGIAADAVDTTGAGDCFVGAVASTLAAGGDLVAAAHLANRAAAISVTRAGAAASYPRRSDMDA